MAQHVNRINLVGSVDNSSKQMQQTPGSSPCGRTDGDDFDMELVAVDEMTVVVVFFLFMVCGNCVRLICLIGRVCGCVSRWGRKERKQRKVEEDNFGLRASFVGW